MKLLALDPGESIGYALFEDLNLRASGTEHYSQIEVLCDLMTAVKPDVVVIERVVAFGLGRMSLNITRVMNVLEHAFHTHSKVHYVRAAEWKPPMAATRSAIMTELRDRPGRITTAHEGDAVCIGRFVQWHRPLWLQVEVS